MSHQVGWCIIYQFIRQSVCPGTYPAVKRSFLALLVSLIEIITELFFDSHSALASQVVLLLNQLLSLLDSRGE